MFGISGHTLEPIDGQLSQRTHIFIFGSKDAYLHSLGSHFHLGLPTPRDTIESDIIEVTADRKEVSLRRITKLLSYTDTSDEARLVKVGIRDRHEHTVDHKLVDLGKFYTLFSEPYSDVRYSLAEIEKQVLEVSHICGLTANAHNRTTLIFRSLLTLIAKHLSHSFIVFFVMSIILILYRKGRGRYSLKT